MLQPFIDTHWDLRGQPYVGAVDGSADDPGRFRVDQRLATDDDEAARSLRVAAGRTADPIDLTSGECQDHGVVAKFHQESWLDTESPVNDLHDMSAAISRKAAT